MKFYIDHVTSVKLTEAERVTAVAFMAASFIPLTVGQKQDGWSAEVNKKYGE